eukprot:365126-Chlamydomonas_euryale.AAC.14
MTVMTAQGQLPARIALPPLVLARRPASSAATPSSVFARHPSTRTSHRDKNAKAAQASSRFGIAVRAKPGVCNMKLSSLHLNAGGLARRGCTTLQSMWKSTQVVTASLTTLAVTQRRASMDRNTQTQSLRWSKNFASARSTSEQLQRLQRA